MHSMPRCACNRIVPPNVQSSQIWLKSDALHERQAHSALVNNNAIARRLFFLRGGGRPYYRQVRERRSVECRPRRWHITFIRAAPLHPQSLASCTCIWASQQDRWEQCKSWRAWSYYFTGGAKCYGITHIAAVYYCVHSTARLQKGYQVFPGDRTLSSLSLRGRLNQGCHWPR